MRLDPSQNCSCVPEICGCSVQVFRVRPWTYEFLQAMRNQFEIIVYSRMNQQQLCEICNQLELNTNKHFRGDQGLRFSLILSKQHYFKAPSGHYLENLNLLLENRLKSSIIFLSSNVVRFMAAIHQGFEAIPVLGYQIYFVDDYQLCLVQNFLLSNYSESAQAVQSQSKF